MLRVLYRSERGLDKNSGGNEMKFKNVITGYYIKEHWSEDFETRSYTMYCIVKEKSALKEIFKTTESKNRADNIREVQIFLSGHPEMINEYIA